MNEPTVSMLAEVFDGKFDGRESIIIVLDPAMAVVLALRLCAGPGDAGVGLREMAVAIMDAQSVCDLAKNHRSTREAIRIIRARIGPEPLPGEN